MPNLKIACEICEDVWVPIPPSSYAALAGATVLVNLSASNITIGKADYRHRLVEPAVVALPGGLPVLLGRPRRVDHRPRLGRPGADLRERRPAGRVRALRHRLALHQRRRRPRARVARADAAELVRHVGREARRPAALLPHGSRSRWRRRPHPRAPCAACVERFPYVPADIARRDERCMEVYNIQVQALLQRLSAIGGKKLVIGISGGLDSTHALLVCAAGDGPARAAARRTSSPTRCPASRPAAARSSRRGG